MLSLPLLFAAYNDLAGVLQLPAQRIRIRQAFEAIRPEGFEGNPVKKIPLTVLQHEGQLLIHKAYHREGPTPPREAPGQSVPVAQAANATTGGTTNGNMPLGNWSWNDQLLTRFMNQYQQVASLIQSEGRATEKLLASMKAYMEGQLLILNQNICR